MGSSQRRSWCGSRASSAVHRGDGGHSAAHLYVALFVTASGRQRAAFMSLQSLSSGDPSSKKICEGHRETRMSDERGDMDSAHFYSICSTFFIPVGLVITNPLQLSSIISALLAFHEKMLGFSFFATADALLDLPQGKNKRAERTPDWEYITKG